MVQLLFHYRDIFVSVIYTQSGQRKIVNFRHTERPRCSAPHNISLDQNGRRFEGILYTEKSKTTSQAMNDIFAIAR